jgi:ParB-like chromosome segregation protein Spo0J
MPEDELGELAADIKANGLVHAIVLAHDGRLIDGRNRLAACKLAGVEPHFETLGPDVDPLAFVISTNVRRRNLTAGQRAIAAAEAALFGVGKNSVQMARALVRDDPIAVERVRAGGDLKTAYDALMKRKGDAADEATKIRRLNNEAPDLAARVTAGALTYDAAIEQLADRRRREREDREATSRLISSGLSAIDPGELASSEWAARVFAKVDPSLSPELRARWKPETVRRCARALDALAQQWERDQ